MPLKGVVVVIVVGNFHCNINIIFVRAYGYISIVGNVKQCLYWDGFCGYIDVYAGYCSAYFNIQ